MTADTNAKSERAHARRTSWLATLEQELRSRVGWADEAVSPYAIGRHAAGARKGRSVALPAIKAA